MYLKVQTIADVDSYMDQLRASARRAQEWLTAQSDDPLDLLRRMKFDTVGFHPIEDRELNFMEQINQTWTFAVALAAARQLLVLHPHIGGTLLIFAKTTGHGQSRHFLTFEPRCTQQNIGFACIIQRWR